MTQRSFCSTGFSAKGLAAQRKRLGLSASDIGQLVGASAKNAQRVRLKPVALAG